MKIILAELKWRLDSIWQTLPIKHVYIGCGGRGEVEVQSARAISFLNMQNEAEFETVVE